jgi:hypothetical protein
LEPLLLALDGVLVVVMLVVVEILVVANDDDDDDDDGDDNIDCDDTGRAGLGVGCVNIDLSSNNTRTTGDLAPSAS